jgi:hypothetical protein
LPRSKVGQQLAEAVRKFAYCRQKRRISSKAPPTFLVNAQFSPKFALMAKTTAAGSFENLLSSIMKKLFGIALFLLIAVAGFSQTAKLTVVFQFKNIVDGYDHDTKTQVIIDGEPVGESGVARESKGASFSVEVPVGKHSIKIMNWALYEGEWQEHTIENDYSIDAKFEDEHNFKKAEKLFLIFDIDNGTMASWKKPVKMPKVD